MGAHFLQQRQQAAAQPPCAPPCRNQPARRGRRPRPANAQCDNHRLSWAQPNIWSELRKQAKARNYPTHRGSKRALNARKAQAATQQQFAAYNTWPRDRRGRAKSGAMPRRQFVTRVARVLRAIDHVHRTARRQLLNRVRTIDLHQHVTEKSVASLMQLLCVARSQTRCGQLTRLHHRSHK